MSQHDFRRRRPQLDRKSRYALYVIAGAVLFQCVLLLGLVLGWWK